MAPSAKGKEKVIDGGKGSSGKRKRNIGGGDDGKTGGRKRKNRGVLQFFDDAAYEVDEDDASDDSFFNDGIFELFHRHFPLAWTIFILLICFSFLFIFTF